MQVQLFLIFVLFGRHFPCPKNSGDVLRKCLSAVTGRRDGIFTEHRGKNEKTSNRSYIYSIMHYTCKYLSPLGEMTIAGNGDSLTGVWFDEQKYFGATLGAEHEERSLPIFEQTREWLDRYFSGSNPGPIPAVAPEGSPFRLAVWEILKRIPYGKVITYKDIAEEIGRQKGVPGMSAQAIGGAVGHNPISIIIPCHRVVGSNGSLTGYAGGISKKVKLLALEQVDMSGLFIPKKGSAL